MADYRTHLLSRPKVHGIRRPEDVLTIAVADTLRLHSVRGHLKAVWFHCPNEGKRSMRAGALAKAMGLIPGVGDFAFLWSSGSGIIELKTEDGRLNPNQRRFSEWCEAQGVAYQVARSPQEVESHLTDWGVLA